VKRVLAVDYSTIACGFAVVGRERGEPVLRWSDIVEWDKDEPHKTRRWQAAHTIADIVVEWSPDAVVFEALRLFNKGKINLTTIVRLCAMCTEIADATDLPVFTVATQTWKRVVLGSGRATKTDAIRWAERAWGKKVNHDEADAIGIGVAVMRMTPAHRRRYLRLFE
jgi:Holliday junction resolvasome RuvABC endonuclease subunit